MKLSDLADVKYESTFKDLVLYVVVIEVDTYSAILG